MPKTSHAGHPARIRVAALGAAVLLLAGCATGYTFVQPDAAAGGYYTGSSYASPGYYYDDDYGAGAWSPGYAGFGYNPYYYGSSLSFGLGFGSVCGWNCGGFYSGWPWYYGGAGYPMWGYYRHGHRHHHHGGHDPVATSPSPRPWRQPDDARVPPAMTRGVPPIAIPERPREDLANRHPLESAGFAPHDFPSMRASRPMGTRARPIGMPRQAPAFAERPMRMEPIHSAPVRSFAPARPAFVPAPAPVNSSRTPATKIR